MEEPAYPAWRARLRELAREVAIVVGGGAVVGGILVALEPTPRQVHTVMFALLVAALALLGAMLVTPPTEEDWDEPMPFPVWRAVAGGAVGALLGLGIVAVAAYR